MRDEKEEAEYREGQLRLLKEVVELMDRYPLATTEELAEKLTEEQRAAFKLFFGTV